MLRTSVRYFLAVARAGSIRGASQELGVATSAVSRQLQALEHEVRAPILERYSDGIKLTAAGRSLYRHAKSASFKIERILSELNELKGVPPDRIRLSVVETITSYALPRAISSFVADYQDAQFSIRLEKSSGVIEDIVNDRADFGVCVNAVPTEDIEILHRFAEPLFAVVPKSHPLAAAAQLTIEDLADYASATSTRLTGVGLALDLAFRKAGIPLRIRLETDSLELLRQFVGRGHGVAVMTRQSCISGLIESEFLAVPLRDDRLDTVTTDVIAAPNRALPLPSERFLKRIEVELRSQNVSGRGA